MIFNRLVFEYLGGDDGILAQEPMQRLTAAEKQLRAYRHEGCLFAMESYREYKYLNELLQEGKAPWEVWE